MPIQISYNQIFPTFNIKPPSNNNHLLYWHTTPLPILSNTNTNLKNVQSKSMFKLPIFSIDNYINSTYHQKQSKQNQTLFESMPLFLKNLNNEKNKKIDSVSNENINIESLTVRQLYKKTLYTLCHWLSKLFYNVSIDGCIDIINQNTKFNL